MSDYLQRRGVASAAQEMKWRQANWYGTPGYALPVSDAGGARDRFRATGSLPDGSKTRWMGESGSYTPRFYHHPAIEQAIEQADGKLIVASGEFDLLTFIENNRYNVVSFSSENAIPADFADKCRAWGVKHIDYWPDNDAAGLLSGRRVKDTVEAAGITCNVYSLAALVPDKGDTNDLWQAVGFNSPAFIAALGSCPLADLPAVEQPTTRPAGNYQYTGDDWPPEFVQAVVGRLEGQPKAKKRGKWITLPSPFRDDRNPSFGFNLETNWGTDFATGQGIGIVELGRTLDIEINDYRQQGRADLPGENTYSHKLNDAPDTDGQKPKMSFDDRVRMLTRNLSAFYQPPEFTSTHSVNMRYISDLDPAIPLAHDAAVIKSGIGTGKTEYIERLVDAFSAQRGRGARVLILTHRVALADDLADRLGYACYRAYSDDLAQYLTAHDRLVMSYNSAWKLAASGELPRYDMVFIDEHEQFQSYLDNDGTWNHDRQEAERAYKVVKALVSRSTFTAVMDAHMTDVSVAWVKSLKDQVAVIENTYTHDRGTLHLHRFKETAIAAAVQMAGEGKGCVLVSCSSRDKARDVAAIAREALGDERVMLVFGDNSLDDDVQGFIKQINSRVNDYAILVYSPSLGTGIDITAPVRATVGIFTGQHMTAADYHQMLGRARNTGETHAYVQPIEEGNREIDWRVLYRIAETRALRTGQYCDFDDDGVLAVGESHQSMLKLTTMLKANENRMKNDPVAAFLALAAGYQITTSEANDDDLKERMEAAEEARKQQDKERTLAAETVDHEALEAHRVTGTLTQEVRYGHKRFVIEDAAGLELTETIYDDLHTSDSREKLRRFTDLLDDPENLKAIDRAEARKPLTKRRHRAIRRALAQRAISDTFGEIDSNEVIPAGELVERLTPFLNLNAADVDYFFERRADASQDSIQTLRVILQKSGLHLASENRMTNGIRQQHYWIEPDQRRTMKEYAAARLKHLEAKRTERQAEKRTYHGENIELQESRVSSLSADVQQPPAPPDAPKSDFRARLAAGKPVNPFAKGYFS